MECFAELPADVPSQNNLGCGGGSPSKDVVLQPLIENVTRKREHLAIHVEIITVYDRADSTQMVSEKAVGGHRIEVSELRDISEAQLKRDRDVILRLPDNNSVLVSFKRFIILRHRGWRRWACRVCCQLQRLGCVRHVRWQYCGIDHRQRARRLIRTRRIRSSQAVNPAL